MRSIRALVTRVVPWTTSPISARVRSSCLQQFGEALQRANRGVVSRGQAFVEADFVALRIEQDEVGEGAADVETDTIAVGGRHSGFPCNSGG